MPDNQTPRALRRRRIGDVVGLGLALLFSPLILLVWLYWLARTLALRAVVLMAAWAPRGRRILFVYSDSPVWGEYIRDRILPRLPPSAVILNWSERSKWRRTSLAVWTFRHYAGAREFNPLGLIVPAFGRARFYRFWRPFRDFKHGKPEALLALEAKFFDEVSH